VALALSTDERRRIGTVLETAERTPSLAGMMTATLEALDSELGLPVSAFMLTVADPPRPGHRAYAGVTHGSPPYAIEEYFERWADRDHLASAASVALFEQRGWSTTADVYRHLEPERRPFVDDFLRRLRQRGQISVRVAADWTDGYLTLLAPEQQGEHELAAVTALVPRLTELLRERLPVGFQCGLSRRETQVAELVALGFSNGEIAGVLHVEEDTIKKHVSHALGKAGLERRTQLAVAWATGRRMDLS
jgi:DNA-binding CsgD family transcriptional regulator